MKERKYYLDILRILACFCVLVNHTDNLIFWWQAAPFSETWYVSILYFFAAKIAVPIYLMISGALLLEKEESYGETLKKRFLRPALAVFAVSFFYYLARPDLYWNGEFHFLAFLQRIYTKRISNAFWYMYMYLGLMLLLPVLRRTVKQLKEADFIYLAVLHGVVLGVLPILSHFAGWPELSSHFTLVFFSEYLIYFLMGYYMEHVMPLKRLNGKGALGALFAYLFMTLISAYAMCHEYAVTGELSFFMDNLSFITVAVQSYSVFYLVKYLCFKRKKDFSGKIKALLSTISSCTFGIYLFSDFLIWKYEVLYNYCITMMNRIPAVVIYEMAVFITGLIITWLIKKIPVVRKLF